MRAGILEKKRVACLSNSRQPIRKHPMGNAPLPLLFCKQGCWKIQRVGAGLPLEGAAARPLGTLPSRSLWETGKLQPPLLVHKGRLILWGGVGPGGRKGLYKEPPGPLH